MINNLMSSDTSTDSRDEKYFEEYLEILLTNDIIKSYHRCNKLVIFDKVTYPRTLTKRNKRHKKKIVNTVKKSNMTLLNEKTYTPDYLIIWNQDWKDTFYIDVNNAESNAPFKAQMCNDTGQYYSVVDVKPSASLRVLKFTSSHTFAHCQAMIYLRYKIYIQKIRLDVLKQKTFNYKNPETLDVFLSQAVCEL
jgi:hypothetical protein